jgi:hypothetical protein
VESKSTFNGGEVVLKASQRDWKNWAPLHNIEICT